MSSILVLDNYDSFTYNLAQLVGELGHEPLVIRNDALDVEGAIALCPSAIIISPGPGTPGAAGISIPLIRAAAGRVPVLGVCLGHQAIGAAFGANVVRADRLMHGKIGRIAHDGDPLFDGMPAEFDAMRYHSLIISPTDLPADLAVIAWSADRARGGEIMAVRHRTTALVGVQFHPESIGTPAGRKVLENFFLTSLMIAA